MQTYNTNLDSPSVTLTLSLEERAALLEHVTDMPRPLSETLRLTYVRRDRVRVSPANLEFLDVRLGLPQARSAPKGVRAILTRIREQIVEELNLLNARTSSVAVDNAAHTLYKSGLKEKTTPTLKDAEVMVTKLRALPLRLRGLKLTAKDKRLLKRCGLPKETLARANSAIPSLNLADVLVILSKRYGFDQAGQAALVAELLELRSRILDYLDEESRLTVQINRKRALLTQQEWRRKSND